MVVIVESVLAQLTSGIKVLTVTVDDAAVLPTVDANAIRSWNSYSEAPVRPVTVTRVSLCASVSPSSVESATLVHVAVQGVELAGLTRYLYCHV